MKQRQFYTVIIIGGCLTAFSLSFLMSSPTLHLLEEKDIQLVANRVNNRSLFTIKLDDFGQPISYGPLISDESIPTMAGATSQQQILQDQLEEIRQAVENAQDELEILKIQKNILIEESSTYVESLEKTFSTPLESIKENIQSLGFSDSDLPIIALNSCIESINQFILNPNQSDFESSLTVSLEQLNTGLDGEETSGWIETASRFFQFGKTQTQLSVQLTKAKEIMTGFSDQISSSASPELEAFKKTKRQQKATEDAISTKYVELDELILELSGILSEIEEVTQ